MSKLRSLLSRNFRGFLLIAVFAAVIYLAGQNIIAFGNILLVLLGFGAMILAHEFGHFIVAKLSGIKVEVFSLGFPPVLVGILRTESGYRVRILPQFFPKEDGSDEGALSFTIGKKNRAGKKGAILQKKRKVGSETEYCIGLIPFGGFVKMLGQEDTKAAEATDDPSSYANKSVGIRMAVIAAGVFFNVISAVIIFMVVFLIGIKLSPAVVGGVMPNSPAARAGLRAGDEIIEVAGKNGNLDFSDVAVAAALSDKGEEVKLKVKHEDDSVENFALVAEQLQGVPMRGFGIFPPQTLTVGKVSDANALFEKTGLLPGDRIKAINGTDVQTYWQLEKVVRDTVAPKVRLLAERADPVSKEVKLVESQIKLNPYLAQGRVESESDLSHIYSMVPRLKITSVSSGPASFKDRVMSLLSRIGIGKIDTSISLQSGDIILAVGDVGTPTYKELREVTTEYENEEMPIKVLRTDANGVEEDLTVTVVPKRSADGKRVVIGIFLAPAFDAEHPVVAKTIDTEGGLKALAIPRGAEITAVDGIEVSNFYDIVRQITRNVGERITIDYRLDEQIAGDVVLDVNTGRDFITVRSDFAELIPFEYLEKLYKATGPIDAVAMGYKKTVMFIVQSYMTLKRFIGGLVSPKNFMGPVGIFTFSYRIVTEKPLIYYFYFLGLISAFIAVFNFLPLLPFDGGHIVFLLIEKIKGSAVSERVQSVAAYAGLVLVGAFALYVTFNDIVRSFFS